MAAEREVGTVKWFDADRGYGFISRGGGDDVFVHINDVKQSGLDTLDDGDRVSFAVTDAPKGPKAVNLERAQTRSRAARPNKTDRPKLTKKTEFNFGPEYLQEGYFTDESQKYLRPAILDTLAMDVARALGNAGIKSSQLRRFFNKARSIESKLDRVDDFEAIKADVYGFKRDVAYQVGRGVVPQQFQQFIDRNVELAVRDEDSFRKGFLQHFESVLAYFVYFFRE